MTAVCAEDGKRLLKSPPLILKLTTHCPKTPPHRYRELSNHQSFLLAQVFSENC